ncbi:MAG: HAMP domain-containing histidine kinase [Rikenellaceae bacterium]|nr:HAMP domain-containing histidine kinase [Rikenellaceae bacterium]
MGRWRLSNLSYQGKRQIIFIGLIIGISSILYTNSLARQLRIKEQEEVRNWSDFMQSYSKFNGSDPFLLYFEGNIPYIITDENLNVQRVHRIKRSVVNNPKLLRKKMVQFANLGNYREFKINRWTYYIFFDQSSLQKALYYFPYLQMGIIGIFAIFAYLTFSSTKHDEQNRVWIGMAKETAHQLGTPTSSLLGWIEYLKTQNVDDFVIEEMNKDLTRLLKIVDRFSKIGAVTSFSEKDITELVKNTVDYFRARIPKNVILEYNQPALPMFALINEALFEWVIENLLKNALDALQGKGCICVRISEADKWINIDVKDTGKGIAKANVKRIFEPGFTTKTRGWGLGLSLSRRIIEDYHKGKIYVLDSELDKGTIIRVSILSAAYSDLNHRKKLFENFLNKKLPVSRQSSSN